MKWFIFLFISYTSNGQVFDFKAGKLDLSQTFLIKKSFQFTVKSKLGMYASDYNGFVNFEANKMKDYVTYEDSSTITAIVKFLAVQNTQETLWDGEVLFERKGDSLLVKIEKLKYLKFFNYLLQGDATFQDKELTEELNLKLPTAMLKKLKTRIDVFFSKFNGL